MRSVVEGVVWPHLRLPGDGRGFWGRRKGGCSRQFRRRLHRGSRRRRRRRRLHRRLWRRCRLWRRRRRRRLRRAQRVLGGCGYDGHSLYSINFRNAAAAGLRWRRHRTLASHHAGPTAHRTRTDGAGNSGSPRQQAAVQLCHRQAATAAAQQRLCQAEADARIQRCKQRLLLTDSRVLRMLAATQHSHSASERDKAVAECPAHHPRGRAPPRLTRALTNQRTRRRTTRFRQDCGILAQSTAGAACDDASSSSAHPLSRALCRRTAGKAAKFKCAVRVCIRSGKYAVCYGSGCIPAQGTAAAASSALGGEACNASVPAPPDACLFVTISTSHLRGSPAPQQPAAGCSSRLNGLPVRSTTADAASTSSMKACARERVSSASSPRRRCDGAP